MEDGIFILSHSDFIRIKTFFFLKDTVKKIKMRLMEWLKW
jgi:hypothetical protein